MSRGEAAPLLAPSHTTISLPLHVNTMSKPLDLGTIRKTLPIFRMHARYKIFGKALERVQNDSQVKVRIGSPVTGYGQESRNRAARQRIPNRVWKDEDGVEHVEVNFYIRGPHGAGKVFAEMFKNNSDKQWRFTYLIVEIMSPTHAQLMLESYVPS